MKTRRQSYHIHFTSETRMASACGWTKRLYVTYTCVPLSNLLVRLLSFPPCHIFKEAFLIQALCKLLTNDHYVLPNSDISSYGTKTYNRLLDRGRLIILFLHTRIIAAYPYLLTSLVHERQKMEGASCLFPLRCTLLSLRSNPQKCFQHAKGKGSLKESRWKNTDCR